jgi:hypothetical protein
MWIIISFRYKSSLSSLNLFVKPDERWTVLAMCNKTIFRYILLRYLSAQFSMLSDSSFSCFPYFDVYETEMKMITMENNESVTNPVVTNCETNVISSCI